MSVAEDKVLCYLLFSLLFFANERSFVGGGWDGIGFVKPLIFLSILTMKRTREYVLEGTFAYDLRDQHIRPGPL